MSSSKILNLALFGAVKNSSLEEFKEIWKKHDRSNIFDQKVIRFAIINVRKDIIEFLLLEEKVGIDWIPDPSAEESECPCWNCDAERLSAHGLAGRLPFDTWHKDVKNIVDIFHSIKPYPNYEKMGLYHGWIKNPEDILEMIGSSANEKPHADDITNFIKLIQEHWTGDEETQVRGFIEKYPNQLPILLIQALRGRVHRALSNMLYVGGKIEDTHFQDIFSNGNPMFFERSETYLETVQIVMTFGLVPDVLIMRAAFELGDSNVFNALLEKFTGDINEVFVYNRDEDDLESYGEIALSCLKNLKESK